MANTYQCKNNENVMRFNNNIKTRYPNSSNSSNISNYHKNIYSTIRRKHPELVQIMLSELIEVLGYTETDIAFGMQLPLHVVRDIYRGDYQGMSRRVFNGILSLYTRVFCGRYCFYDDGCY